ncbi:MAG: primosomal protein N' [Dehalococcoidia bacterium]|nr:primosomal protein N' [Dehalococcoidia bacterium]
MSDHPAHAVDPAFVPPEGTVFAEVAVHTTQPARRPFTYAVPPGMEVAPGMAVFVPFGPRIVQGIVLRMRDRSDVEAVRPISAVMDPVPLLDPARIALAEWVCEEYLAPLWECVACCLPAGFGQKPVTMVSPVDVPPLLPVYPKDRAILQYIAEHGRVTLDELREAVGPVSLTTLQRLQQEGHLTVTQGLARPTGRPKFERRVALAVEPTAARAEAERLLAERTRSVEGRVLLRLAEEPDLPLAAVRALGTTPAHLERLAERGFIRAYERRVERDPVAAVRGGQRPPAALSPEQLAAAETAWRERVTLIHGVTGSGKTEVYLDLVGRALEAGGGAIVLVPEISLTPQAIRRFGERFGDELAVFHSRLSTGELYDQWFRVERGDARLVLGSRSAVFAPVRRLELVVLDEEHEWSYKQSDPVPRYHARDVALKLGELTGARVVLGSATPDVVTYHRSETGQIARVELATRLAPAEDGSVTEGALPSVQVVDMREELQAGNRSMFSRALRQAVREALAAGEQAILFVNRRGSARFVLCRDCGFLPLCPSCEVAMSLDAEASIHAMLRCHHCGRTKRLEDRCPNCDSLRYRPFGVGTQRVEAEARAVFRGARVARWDSDTARTRDAHERMVAELEAGRVDIVVGTQLLAKGLDLARLTVVGVVDADVGLSLPDYRAAERTYQLLSQVAGRAGRRDRPGRVFIQTYEPEAPPIVAAAEHDYRGFYESEIAHRRRAGYPPFSRIARLVYRHHDETAGLEEASRVARELRVLRDAAGRAEPEILGPTRPFIPRVRGEVRWQILLRGRAPGTLIGQVRLGDRWQVDIDPASLL